MWLKRSARRLDQYKEVREWLKKAADQSREDAGAELAQVEQFLAREEQKQDAAMVIMKRRQRGTFFDLRKFAGLINDVKWTISHQYSEEELETLKTYFFDPVIHGDAADWHEMWYTLEFGGSESTRELYSTNAYLLRKKTGFTSLRDASQTEKEEVIDYLDDVILVSCRIVKRAYTVDDYHVKPGTPKAQEVDELIRNSYEATKIFKMLMDCDEEKILRHTETFIMNHQGLHKCYCRFALAIFNYFCTTSDGLMEKKEVFRCWERMYDSIGELAVANMWKDSDGRSATPADLNKEIRKAAEDAGVPV